jgi:hypothetical protein
MYSIDVTVGARPSTRRTAGMLANESRGFAAIVRAEQGRGGSSSYSTGRRLAPEGAAY